MVTAAAALDKFSARRPRWPGIYAATVLLCGVGYAAAPSMGVRQWLFALVAGSAVVAIVVGIRAYRPFIIINGLWQD